MTGSRSTAVRRVTTALRSWTVWAIRYGLPGLGIRVLARRGDLIARATADPTALDDAAAFYAGLRELGPLASNRLVNASAHHRIVNQILRDDNFLADPGGAPTKLLGRVMGAAIDPRALGPVDIPSLLAIHPPQHTRIRRLAGQAFTPRAIAGYAEHIRAIANDLLDQVDPTRFDLVADYAALLPVIVIADIIGVPEHMRGELLQIGNDAALTLDPALTWRDYRAAESAIRLGNTYLEEHIADVRRNPGDDLLSELVRANQDGDRLSDDELRVNTLLLLGAGFETTVSLIGNAVALLLAHPDQLAHLQANPQGWDNAVDEVLRYDSPVQVTVRVGREPTEIAGRRVPTGQFVVLMLGAANRDPAVFADPDHFDVTRRTPAITSRSRPASTTASARSSPASRRVSRCRRSSSGCPVSRWPGCPNAARPGCSAASSTFRSAPRCGARQRRPSQLGRRAKDEHATDDVARLEEPAHDRGLSRRLSPRRLVMVAAVEFVGHVAEGRVQSLDSASASPIWAASATRRPARPTRSARSPAVGT